MKVTRKQLFKKLIPFFEEEMGYTYFKDTILADGGIFIKKIDDKIYVCIGIDTSNLFVNSFTCNYYMGQSLTYALLYEGIRDAYMRPCQLLSKGDLENIIAMVCCRNCIGGIVMMTVLSNPSRKLYE